MSTQQINLRVATHVKEELDRIGFKTGRTTQEVIRAVVGEWLIQRGWEAPLDADDDAPDDEAPTLQEAAG